MSDQAWHERTDADGETTERRHHPSREPEGPSEEHIPVGASVDTAAHVLHVFKDAEGEDWCVWLNTEVSDFDGLLLATGKDRQQAVDRAVAVVEAMENALQGPAPASVDRASKFHAHLDVCRQCSNNPMALCAEGSRLLGAAVGGD